MRVVVVTLEKIEIRDPSLKLQKISLSLQFGDKNKKIPKPRFIRNKAANFYGEKISVSTSDPSVKQVVLSVYGIATVEEQLLGEVVIDVKELEKKEDVNDFFQIQEEKFNMEFEAMYSSSMNLSPRNFSPAPKTPNGSEISQTIPTKLIKKDSLKERRQLDQTNQISLSKLKALQKAEEGNSPKLLKRQQSNRKLSRASNFKNDKNDDDRKSEISEKPASQRKFERTSSRTATKQVDTEKTKSQSGYRPRDTPTGRRDRSVTPTKSVRSDISNVSKTVKKQKPERKPKVQEKKEKESPELGMKDYIKFIAISVAALIFGVVVKQW